MVRLVPKFSWGLWLVRWGGSAPSYPRWPGVPSPSLPLCMLVCFFVFFIFIFWLSWWERVTSVEVICLCQSGRSSLDHDSEMLKIGLDEFKVSTNCAWICASLSREVQRYCVHLQCTCQMLCSFIADFVQSKIQRCECLCAMKIGDRRWDADKSSLTVFICNALAKCCAPSAAIAFHLRSSDVSVYVKWR